MPIDGGAVALSAVGGLVGGVGLCVVGHPFDTVKLRLQTGQFATVPDACRAIWRDRGLPGFYVGVASPLCLQMVFRSWLFASFQVSKDLVGHDRIFLAGALTGLSAALVESPMLLLMNQAQAHNTTVRARARALVTGNGVRALAQGMPATAIRNVPANAFYLGVFSELNGQRGWHPLAAGGVGGIAYWIVTYPLDAVRGCMHADDPNPAKRKYTGWAHCFTTLLREGGVRRLFRGYLPCMARAVPANATFFVLAEGAKKRYKQFAA
uniref:Mitochondrial carrier protein n=1 Tax=Neobodo designis TaxID=312471 RepID=A0A7S1M7N7_NEODS|mmetsp:Transcript_35749/g.110194  ORF Transcript_35749/g.110194 Transcript_35749/m.110194 type:complete len:266 (+) Transcript_35749:59-856(+)